MDDCSCYVKIRRWMNKKQQHQKCIFLVVALPIIIICYFIHQSCILPYSCSAKLYDNYISDNDSVLEIPFEFTNQGKYKFNKILETFRNLPSKLLFVVIVASSARDPHGEQLRNAIRRTWGNCKGRELKESLIGREIARLSKSSFKSHDIEKYNNCGVVFNLGITNNEDYDRNIRLEAAKYGDIIVSDVVENYRNMTLKLRAGLRAISALDAKYIVKVDNDVYMNLPKLAWFLINDPNVPRMLYGGVTYTGRVVRDPHHKHYVCFQDYSEKYYPTFIKGSVVVLSGNLLHRIIKMFSNIKPFNIDDAYLGIVIKKLGIKPFKIDRIVQFDFLPMMISHLHLCDFSYLIGVGDSMKAEDIYKVHEQMKSSALLPFWMCWHLNLPGCIAILVSIFVVCFWYVKVYRRR